MGGLSLEPLPLPFDGTETTRTPSSMASNKKQDSPWDDLPEGFMQKIGDIFLSTDDFDYYAAFRAVCSAWRGFMEGRFIPANWILLEHQLSLEYGVDDAAITLLKVRTSRYLEKKISRVIRRCFLDIHLYMCDPFFAFT